MAEACDYNSKLSREIEIFDVLIALIIVGLSIFSLVSYNLYKEELSQEILTYGWIGMIFATAFLELVPQVLTPFFIPLVGISSGISWYLVLFFVILGSVLGSILGFELGRKYGWKLICPLVKKQTSIKILNFWEKYGKVFVLFSAVTPLPYFPLVFGALGLSRKHFLIWGVIPRVIAFTAVVVGYYFGIFYTFA
jgi:membrane protein YqaA with SNARE-associated domain